MSESGEVTMGIGMPLADRYDGKGLSFFKNSSGRNSNIWIYNRLNLIDLSERRSYLSSPIGRSDRKKI